MWCVYITLESCHCLNDDTNKLNFLFILGRPEKLNLNENRVLNSNYNVFVLTKLNVHITIDRVYFHVQSVMDIYELTSGKYSVKRITK